MALAAVLLNARISLWLHAEAKHDLNIRSADLHVLGGALPAAGAVIALTGQTVADPVPGDETARRPHRPRGPVGLTLPGRKYG